MSKTLKTLKRKLSRKEPGNETDSTSNCEPESRPIERNDEIILELLGKKYINRILSLTSKRECTTIELSLELDIPLATVYRKLKLLEEKEMIEVSRTKINLSGNEEKYYRCLIDEAAVNFHDGKIYVNIKKLDHAKKIVKIWERLKNLEFLQDNKTTIHQIMNFDS